MAARHEEGCYFFFSPRIFLFAKGYRTVMSGWQGEPYFRRYGREGAGFKTGVFVKRKVERLRGDPKGNDKVTSRRRHKKKTLTIRVKVNKNKKTKNSGKQTRRKAGKDAHITRQLFVQGCALDKKKKSTLPSRRKLTAPHTQNTTMPGRR